ncbi:MAG: enoyl-CoA hydratase/isomerase family protein [SAR202 cluster bacterium]|nr:MAG: enoyl-CoA hydratase/isomerase family protein [SAR202 cluster bacterium]MQG74797.1 enoyl-CoA hydratase/isomerase family protein [SAR202 cluster bacterium]
MNIQNPVVLYECSGDVATITLNRPSYINAFSVQMRDELYETLKLLRDDPNAKVAILKGSGERGFCAGADLTEFGTAPSQVIAREVRWERDLWGLFHTQPKPIVAALHGYVIGSGIEIASLCDIRIAADNCIFRMPEVALGMVPAAGGTQTIPRLIGTSRTSEFILSNRVMEVGEARKIGLVDRVVPRSELLKECLSVSRILSRHDNSALILARRAILLGLDLSLSEGLKLEKRFAETLSVV